MWAAKCESFAPCCSHFPGPPFAWQGAACRTLLNTLLFYSKNVKGVQNLNLLCPFPTVVSDDWFVQASGRYPGAGLRLLKVSSYVCLGYCL